MVDDVEFSMVFGDGRATSSRVAAIAWGNGSTLTSLLLLNVFSKVGKGLGWWLVQEERVPTCADKNIRARPSVSPVVFVYLVEQTLYDGWIRRNWVDDRKNGEGG